MSYFINCYQFVGSDRDYHSYRLYTGDSEESLKKSLIADIKEEWFDYPSLKSIDLSQNFSDIIGDIIEHISSEVYDYELVVDGPYTDTTKAFDFYNEYVSEEDESLNLFHSADYTFDFYGDYYYSTKHREVFPYLAELHRDTGIHISTDDISRIADLLG